MLGSDGLEVKDGGSRLVGFFRVEGEVQGPIVEVVGVNEGLVDGEAVFGEVGVAGFGIEADLVAGGVVGVELLEEAFVGSRLANAAEERLACPDLFDGQMPEYGL